MAENPGPSDAAGKRPRITPTIDLTATEVARDLGTPESSAAAFGGEAAAESEFGSGQERSGAAAAEMNPDLPPDTMQASSAAETGEADAGSGRGGFGSPPPAERPAPRGSFASHVGAGVLGGLLVSAAAGALWYGGLAPSRNDEAARDATWNSLAARIAAVETQIRAVPKQTAGAAGADPKAVQDLNARLAKLETAGATPRTTPDPALTGRLDATESAAKSLSTDLEQLRRRADENADAAQQAVRRAEAAATAAESAQTAARSAGAERQDIDRLSARVATVEEAAKTAHAELARQAATAGDARTLRFAIAATALKSAVEAGHPFRAQLTALKSVAGSNDLAALEPFADSGVPAAAVLSRELSDLAPAMLRAAGPSTTGEGFLDRLQVHAKDLVRIRRVDDTPGDDPSTVIGRMELRAAQGDLESAAAEIGRLPPAARAPAAEWLKKAQARVAAIALSRRLEAEALAGLGKAS